MMEVSTTEFTMQENTEFAKMIVEDLLNQAANIVGM